MHQRGSAFFTVPIDGRTSSRLERSCSDSLARSLQILFQKGIYMILEPRDGLKDDGVSDLVDGNPSSKILPGKREFAFNGLNIRFDKIDLPYNELTPEKAWIVLTKHLSCEIPEEETEPHGRDDLV